MLRLPTFTFLNAPVGAGKTTLATALAEEDTRLGYLSFEEPLRMTLLATFYPFDMMQGGGIDLRSEAELLKPLDGMNIRRGVFMGAYRNFLERLSPNILGDLARRTTERLTSYDRFVFDDCTKETDIKPFVLAHGAQNCLLLHIERDNVKWDAQTDLRKSMLKHVSIYNRSGPASMLQQLRAILGVWGEEAPPPDSLPPSPVSISDL